MTVKVGQEPVDVSVEDLGGTEDWGDEDLGSVDDLDFDGTESSEFDDDDGSPVVEEADETEDADEESDEEVDESDESDETDEEIDEESDEETDETDEETDDADSEEEEVEAKAHKEDNRVPRSRLNKEVDKRRALEARIAELESIKEQAPEPTPVPEKTAPAFTVDDFKAMSDAILDGDDATALEKFSSMTQAQVEKAVKNVRDAARDDARSEIQADRDMTDLQEAAVSITEKYPEFDSNSDLADKALIDDVLDLRDAFEQKGISPAKALQKATRLVALDNDLLDRTVKSIDESPKKRGVRKPDVKKKMKLAKKERGKLQGQNRSQKLAKPLAELSDKEFNEASEEALAKARGDFL